MARKKAEKKVEVVEEVVEVVEGPVSNVTINEDRWDGTVNTLEAPKLPSLND